MTRRSTIVGRVPSSQAAVYATRRKGYDVDIVETTLLALVSSVAEVTSDDREVVATVSALLRSGAVRLLGALRDCPIECLLK